MHAEPLNNGHFWSEDFKELLDRIKYKTTYKVDFDSEKLAEQCCEKMQSELIECRCCQADVY